MMVEVFLQKLNQIPNVSSPLHSLEFLLQALILRTLDK